jgi:hypothetical protein
LVFNKHSECTSITSVGLWALGTCHRAQSVGRSLGSEIVGTLLDLQVRDHSLDIAIRNHRFLPSITQPDKPTKPEHCHAQRSRKVGNVSAERKMKVRKVGRRSFMFTLGAHEVCLNRELNASTRQGENRGSFRDGHCQTTLGNWHSMSQVQERQITSGRFH